MSANYTYTSNKGYVPIWVIVFTYHGWRFLLRPFGKDVSDKIHYQICKKFWILLGIFFGPLVVLLSISNFAGWPLLSKIAWIEVLLVPTALLVIWGLRVFFKKFGGNIADKILDAEYTVEDFFSKKVVWIPIAVVALTALVVGVVLAFVYFWSQIMMVTGFVVWIGGGATLIVLGLRELANLVDDWWNQRERVNRRKTARIERQKKEVIREARKAERNTWHNKSLNPVARFLVNMGMGIWWLVRLVVFGVIALFVWLWKNILFPVLRGFAVMIRSAYKRACPLVTVERVEVK